MSATGVDPVLAALLAVVADLEANLEATVVAIERAKEIAELRRQGKAYREITDATGRPLVIRLIAENLVRLQTSGAVLRFEQAKALHDEGLTMEEIGGLFGVSRQRVSAILKGRGRSRSS